MTTRLFVVFLEIGTAGTAAGGLLLLLHKRLQQRYTAQTICVLWIVLALWLVLPLQVLLPASAQIELPQEWAEEPSEARTVETAPLPPEAAGAEGASASAAQGQAGRKGQAVPLFLTAALYLFSSLWLGGAFLYGSVQAAAYRRFLASLRSGILPAPQKLRAHLEVQKARLGIRRTITLRVSREADCPMLTGLLHPVLWFPPDRLESDWDMILQHELAHYRHGDLYWKWLWAAARTIHWYNPLIRRMEWTAQEEIELSCDEAVICRLDNAGRYAYGEVLLRSVSEQVHRNRPAFCMAGDKEAMMKRMKNIFDTTKKKRGIGMCLAAVLVLGTTGFTFHVQAAELSRQTVSGVVEDALMGTLKLRTEDGHTYEFDKSGAQVSAGSDGLTIGDPVTVTYTGSLEPEKTAQHVEVIAITEQDAALSVTGTVEDALMSTLVIRAEDGCRYEFDKSNAQIRDGGNGIHIGDTVTVTYTGTQEAALMAQKVTVLSAASQSLS